MIKKLLILSGLATVLAPQGISWILALEHFGVADFSRNMNRVEHILVLVIIFLLCMLADSKKKARKSAA